MAKKAVKKTRVKKESTEVVEASKEEVVVKMSDLVAAHNGLVAGFSALKAKVDILGQLMDKVQADLKASTVTQVSTTLSPCDQSSTRRDELPSTFNGAFKQTVQGGDPLDDI